MTDQSTQRLTATRTFWLFTPQQPRWRQIRLFEAFVAIDRAIHETPQNCEGWKLAVVYASEGAGQ